MMAGSKTVAPAPVAAGSGTRVLVAGWFSWTDAGATAGDIFARDVACEWLVQAGRAYDVANATPFGRGVDWRSVDPALYSEVVFVCGPVGRTTYVMDLVRRFRGSRMVGLNVTMLEDVQTWNPFHALLERDSNENARPDLAFAAPANPVPLVGVVLVGTYEPEYPDRDRQPAAIEAIEALIEAQHVAPVYIDTVLGENATGLRTAAEVESVIARMDAVVTTRLHGLVLALKNGVPALAIDPVAGGSKIARQAETIGWPLFRTADQLKAEDLALALRECLSERGKAMAAECARKVEDQLERQREEFIRALRSET